MKLHLLAGVALACLALAACGLSGCSTAQTQALAPFTAAAAQNLPHCHVWGSVNGSIGGLSAPQAGNNFAFDCPAQPSAATSAVPPTAPSTPAAP